MLQQIVIEEIAQERQSELSAEIETARLLKENDSPRINLQDRFAFRIGELLISTGVRLQEQYKCASDPACVKVAVH